MGRKKIELTEAEIAERKQRWWGAERNARRRERYASDPEYRNRAIQQVRENYRTTREKDGLEVRQDDCRENANRLHMIGEVREVRIDEEHSMRMLTFVIAELAAAVGRNPQVVYRWIQNDLIPGPAFEARNVYNRWQSVYTVGEVRAIMEVFGEHQRASQYFRTFHTDTKTKMHNAVAIARRAAVKSRDAL